MTEPQPQTSYFEHSDYSCSGSVQWINCPGSWHLQRKHPRIESDTLFAREGRVAHALGYRCLTEDTAVESYRGQVIDGIEVDGPMIEAVESYCRLVRSYRATCDIYLEQPVRVDHVVPGCYGTADAIIVDRRSRVITVIDFKYGVYSYVSVKGNSQLLLYLAGAQALMQRQTRAVFNGFAVGISQPRMQNETIVRVTQDELTRFRYKARRAYEQIQLGPELAPLNAGREQCTYCSAKTHCPAFHDYAAETLDVPVESIVARDGTLTPRPASSISLDDLGATFLKVGAIRRFCNDVVDRVNQARGVRAIPGLKAVTGRRGGRYYSDPEAVKKELRRMRVPVSETHTKELKSPAQLSSVLKPKQYSRLERFIEQDEGSLIWVSEDDQREAVQDDPLLLKLSEGTPS